MFCTFIKLPARSVPQVSGRNIRFLTLLQLSAHAGQAGLQAGRAVVEQHLDLSVADAGSGADADGGGEQRSRSFTGRVGSMRASRMSGRGQGSVDLSIGLTSFGLGG